MPIAHDSTILEGEYIIAHLHALQTATYYHPVYRPLVFEYNSQMIIIRKINLTCIFYCHRYNTLLLLILRIGS